MKLRVLVPFILFALSPSAWAAFGYYSPIDVNTGQVPSTETDFPMLISITDARLKTVGNGGHVEDAEGDDIRPYADTGCSTALTYEKVFYDGATGTLEMWVKIASLSDATVVYLAYGDASITTDGSSTATWSANFTGVYHLADGTTLNVNSATGSNNGSNGGATATTGKIDGAGGFASASSQYINLSNGQNTAALTYSAWVKGTTFPNDYNGVMTRGSLSVDRSAFFVKSNGKLYMTVLATNARAYDGTGSHTLSTGTWYYVVLTYDSSAGLVGYVDAASDNTVAANGAAVTTVNETHIGSQTSTGSRYWNGVIDEVRISSVVRSANWITTEYNNQVAPGTFATMGAEVTGCPAATPTATATFTPTPSATFTPTPTATATSTPTPTPPSNGNWFPFLSPGVILPLPRPELCPRPRN